MSRMNSRLSVLPQCLAIILMLLAGCGNAGQAQSSRLAIDTEDWPDTDFSRTTIDLSEVMSGGVGRDVIPAIDNPQFVPVAEYQAYEGIDAMEPVVGVEVNGAFRAYPLRVMIWHEIVNDLLAGVDKVLETRALGILPGWATQI